MKQQKEPKPLTAKEKRKGLTILFVLIFVIIPLFAYLDSILFTIK